jgi:hypothetical protein
VFPQGHHCVVVKLTCHRYLALGERGRTDAPSLELGAPWSDDDVRSAISALNRSTSDISKQTETLKRQQEALSRLSKSTGDGIEDRAAVNSKRLREADRERTQAAQNARLPRSATLGISAYRKAD